jgi:hypothetical protein
MWEENPSYKEGNKQLKLHAQVEKLDVLISNQMKDMIHKWVIVQRS